MYLSDLPINEKACIVQVQGQGSLRRRLLDLGLTPNTQVRVIKVAPLGDPMELSLRGFALTIRREDATKIKVQVIESPTICEQCVHDLCSGKPVLKEVINEADND